MDRLVQKYFQLILTGTIREANVLTALHPSIVIKVPMIKDGIKAIRYLTDKGIATNCTLVFSAGNRLFLLLRQALLMFHHSLEELMIQESMDFN